MEALVCDPAEVDSLIRRRRETGADRYDEVWNGLYVMSPAASLEHQRLVAEFTTMLTEVIARTGRGTVYPGANVTDREDGWEENYRCTDVVVVLKESEARCRDIESALVGGPDFLIEVRSPADKTLDKMDFYGSLGVRELLVVERESKAMSLYRLTGDGLHEVPPTEGWLECQSVGLAFRPRPEEQIEVRTLASPARTWSF